MLENEIEIVERAKKDDRAFEILYDFYFPKIYGYIFKRVGNFDIAEDLVSSTFLKVFTNLHSYNYKGYTFGAWVYRIATNKLIDHYRKEARTPETNIDDIEEPKDKNSDMPEELMQRAQDRRLVQQVMRELHQKHQRILYLKFFAEKPNTIIAEILDTNENNVRVMLFRALKSFKESYKKYETQ